MPEGLAAFRETYTDICSTTGIIIIHAGTETRPINASTLAISAWDL